MKRVRIPRKLKKDIKKAFGEGYYEPIFEEFFINTLRRRREKIMSDWKRSGEFDGVKRSTIRDIKYSLEEIDYERLQNFKLKGKEPEPITCSGIYGH